MRISSSTAFGSSERSAISARFWSGNSVNSFIEPEIELRVVSLPANTIKQPRAVEIFVAQQLAVDGGARDRAHQVGLRIGAALLQHVLAIGEHLRDVFVERLDELHELGRRLRVTALRRRNMTGHFEVMHPVEEFRPVGFRHAEDFAQREQRQPRRQRLDQVAFAKPRHVVDQPRGLGRHLLPDAVEIARREIGHVLLAELQVPGRVHVDHGVDGGAKQQRMARFRRAIGHQDAALLRRKGLWIAIDAHHVVILRQRPEARARCCPRAATPPALRDRSRA